MLILLQLKKRKHYYGKIKSINLLFKYDLNFLSSILIFSREKLDKINYNTFLDQKLQNNKLQKVFEIFIQ